MHMKNMIYGTATMGCLFVLVGMINSHIPNDLWYYIDTYFLPF